MMYDEQTNTSNVVSVTETSKLFLTSCVPNIELHGSKICEEYKRMHLYSQRRNVLLLEFTRLVTFNECCFAGTTISNEHEL